jgi:transcriptional regulator CtsR
LKIINYLDLKIRSSFKKYSEVFEIKGLKIGQVFNVKPGIINYIKEEEKINYLINSDLVYKFSIEGEKKVIFTYKDKSFECGVIIESSFRFENSDVLYNYMFAHVVYRKYHKKSTLFQFFKAFNCYKYLYSGENYLNSLVTILPADYIIPFDDILKLSDEELVYGCSVIDPSQYTYSRNCLNFIDKFAKTCKIQLSNKFKEDLLVNCINTCQTGNEKEENLIELHNDTDKFWEDYVKTESDRKNSCQKLDRKEEE